MAIKKLGWPKIKAVFTDKKLSKIDRIIVSLAENMQRSQLTYKDTANAIRMIFKHYNDVKKVSTALGVSTTTIYNYLKVDQYTTPRIKSMLDKGDVSKDDVIKAIRLSKGNIKETAEILKKLSPMDNYQKKRALDIARDNPKKSSKKILEEAKKPKFQDILTLNLSEEISQALEKAVESLNEEKETLALNALRIWLKDNGFYEQK